MATVNIMIVGVGGQGSLLASKLLGAVASRSGYDVKVSEVHGMSQRGGSVVTYVRFGEKVYSPLICEGEADFVISFEKMEGARYIPFLKPEGTLIVNTQEIAPMGVLTSEKRYPHAILDKYGAQKLTICQPDALSPALSLGSAKAVNMVLMGYFAKQLHLFSFEAWQEAIKETVRPAFREMNQKAFLLGYEMSK